MAEIPSTPLVLPATPRRMTSGDEGSKDFPWRTAGLAAVLVLVCGIGFMFSRKADLPESAKKSSRTPLPRPTIIPDVPKPATPIPKSVTPPPKEDEKKPLPKEDTDPKPKAPDKVDQPDNKPKGESLSTNNKGNNGPLSFGGPGNGGGRGAGGGGGEGGDPLNQYAFFLANQIKKNLRARMEPFRVRIVLDKLGNIKDVRPLDDKANAFIDRIKQVLVAFKNGPPSLNGSHIDLRISDELGQR